MKFAFYHQYDSMDCGPACLQMVARHYGKSYRLATLRERCHITREGVSMLGISDAAEWLGFRTLGVKITPEQLVTESPLPCIAFWNQKHFVVIYDIRQNGTETTLFIADPAHGKVKMTAGDFNRSWLTEGEEEAGGICLLLEPLPEFFSKTGDKPSVTRLDFLRTYVRPHRRYLIQLLMGMIFGSIIQLIFPFLTQAIVDTGIKNQNLSFISLILLAQLALFLGLTMVEFVRGWILLHISTRINITLISDFLIKIMKLPIGFFDSKMVGDLMQRITDHNRIQSFLAVSSLNILFSTVTFILFGAVLFYYSPLIFLVFLLGSLLYSGWVYLFMKRRRKIDYQRFNRMAENQNTLIQLITGMQEIKLQNCEKQKRWEWERIQAKLFKINLKSLSLTQYQSIGAFFFIRTNDILITFLSAYLVIKGELTLGMMLAVQFILGQLSNPVEQMVNFIREAQDAAISMERLDEINAHPEEEDPERPGLTCLPTGGMIRMRGVNFQYEGPHSPFVIRDMTFDVPEQQVTAIVGASGSGKTTLVKLMLGFYKPTTGTIKVGDTPLDEINSSYWRGLCGSVMQDGFIFSDTIANNICLGDEVLDEERLQRALITANLSEFIETLPLGTATRIGQDGTGISVGQKQRILIARAVYRDPQYLFFDEATNSLDAINERQIIENLHDFFKGKTVIIVAHRLSTVRNAQQIIVLDKGAVIETGSHDALIALRGKYYNLVRNQLEMA